MLLGAGSSDSGRFTLSASNSDKVIQGWVSLYLCLCMKDREITIKSDDKSLNRRGIVRRSHEMGDNIYKVGLEFIVR